MWQLPRPNRASLGPGTFTGVYFDVDLESDAGRSWVQHVDGYEHHAEGFPHKSIDSVPRDRSCTRSFDPSDF